MKKYLNSKWTSVQMLLGWRHYEVRNVLVNKKQLELFAVCDKKIKVTIDFRDIKDKKKWVPGWKEIVK